MLSALFGLAFAAIISRRSIQKFVDTFREYIIAGIVLGIVAGGLIFPVAMTRAGVATYHLPFLPVPGLAGELFAVGHLVYGLVLGAVFAAVNGAAPKTIHGRVSTSE